MKKIYIACSLTQAPEEFKKHIEILKKELRKNYEVLEWLGLVKGTPKDVYYHDTQMVKDCDLLLAEVSYPAIGLGFELALALQLKKPIFAMAKKNAKVSRLLMGIDEPNYNFVRYNNIDEIISLIKSKLDG